MEEYQCIDAKTGTIKVRGAEAKRIPKPVLIFDLLSCIDQTAAIKFFQCNKTTKNNYTVSRKGDFAKLYRLTFGESPDARFSRADRLLGHFIGMHFWCETTLEADRLTGESYHKVTSILPVEIHRSDDWTDTGVKRKKSTKKRSSQQKPLDNSLAKIWQKSGKKLANSWQKVGNDESLQPAKTLGLQPFSIPLNHAQQEDKPINTCSNEGQKFNTFSQTEITAIRKPIGNESDVEFLDRFLSETITNTYHPETITCKACRYFNSYYEHGGGAGSCGAGVKPYGACWCADTRHSCESFSSAEMAGDK